MVVFCEDIFMITTRIFRIEKVQHYVVKKGPTFFSKVAVPDGGIDPEEEAKMEFDTLVNQTEKELGEVIQVLKYEVKQWGGCADEFDRAVDRHVVIEATVMFRNNSG
jgi:hypothetical protein